MPGTGQTYLIAGAGISGLTMALALAKFGANVVVLERQPGISEFGAGLQLSPNARRVLDQLGLDEDITARSLEPVGIDIFPFGRPRPLVTLALGEAMTSRFGAPYAIMHRADLADTLHRAARRFANIDIVFGVSNWTVVSQANGVTVTIDQANGQTRTARGRAFIGADGVHSQTRRAQLEGPAADDGHRIAWRTLLPFEATAGQLALDRVSVLFAPHFHMVCYPLPHRQQVNVALFVKAGPAPASRLPALLRHPGGSPRIAAILAAAADSWTPWPLFTVTTPTWSAGAVGLIGDAAHAMVPFQAQGAAMGIEDAAVLAPLLISQPDVPAAFARYQQLRQPRVDRVATTSARNGQIFHLPWPLSMARDRVIAAQGSKGHLRRLAWLYDYDADAAVALPPQQKISAQDPQSTR